MPNTLAAQTALSSRERSPRSRVRSNGAGFMTGPLRCVRPLPMNQHLHSR